MTVYRVELAHADQCWTLNVSQCRPEVEAKHQLTASHVELLIAGYPSPLDRTGYPTTEQSPATVPLFVGDGVIA